MGLLESAFVCIGLWLLFPKGFKYIVGCWVGAASGIFTWGVTALVWLAVTGGDVGWRSLGWALAVLVTLGIVAGCALAARG